MNKLKFLLFTFSAIVLMVGIYSCAKDGNPVEANSKLTVENRASGSACSPQSLFTEYPVCNNSSDSLLIAFTQGPTIFSGSSLIKTLCPGLQVKVYFTHTRCYDLQGDEINFISDVTYDLASMITACAALENAINTQTQFGQLVSFLDRIDHEISMQLEFTMAYNQATGSPFSIDCSGTKYYSVKYIQNTCYKWESFAVGPKDRPIPAYMKVECNGTVCCVRSNVYCVSSYVGNIPLIVTATLVNYQRFEGTCPLDCGHDCGMVPGSF